MIEAREVEVEASVMGSEGDSSTGWISEKELGRGELIRVELAVIEETEEEWVKDIFGHLRQRVYWQGVNEGENMKGWSFL